MFELIPGTVGDWTTIVDGLAPLASTDDDVEEWMVWAIVAAMCLPVGAVSFRLGLDRYRTSQFVADASPEPVEAIVAGRAGVSGVARPFETTYEQPFETGECVFGTWRVREWVPDSSHNPENEEDRRFTWRTKASGTIGDRIVVEDETGAIAVDDPALELSDELQSQRTVDRDHVPSEKIGDFLEDHGVPVASSRRRRYEQAVIPPGSEVRVFGEASPRGADEAALESLRERYDGFRADLVMGRDEESGEFIVTDRDADDASRAHLLWTAAFSLGGAVFVALGAFFLLRAVRLYGLL